MSRTQETNILAHAAKRAKSHPRYLGSILAAYMAIEKTSERNLARLLGISAFDLSRLGLCLRPRPDRFAGDIEEIAAKFSLESTVLAKVVRLVESVHALALSTSRVASANAGVLLAARSRKKKRKPKDRRAK